ncbi:PaaI family thioesterase [Pseudophaeobacter sp.]|jgi:uncharacterized protein (TIGR00369 family)|uniref:PaaI family thioesterase n=1 Tax=Pseudophaeobacter sp. TaxID=1971739 RepID=UPI0032D8DD92
MTKPPVPTAQMRGFGDYVGTRTVTVKPDWGLVELELSDWHQNGIPTVHGGVLLTLLDHACGASLTYGSERSLGTAAVTLSLSASFLKASKGGKLFATGRCVRRGRSIAFCEAEVEDETGAVIARATGSFKMMK